MRIAALYYLLIRLAGVLILPRVAAVIDTTDRMVVIRLSLLLQFLGVLLGAAGIYSLWLTGNNSPSFADPRFFATFTFLVFTGILGSLGASLMDIAIANDLAPSVFSGDELARFNSRFRQVDLATEVGSPVLAGLLLTITLEFPLFGFFLVAVWNLVSFFPEYGILNSVFKERPDLRRKSLPISDSMSQTFFQKLQAGWRAFFREPVAPAMIAYALLWLSALSPHGVLLTGFLQDGWRLPEWMIGLFRGSGAIFGLIATIVFPIALKRLGLMRASLFFLGLQSIMVLLASGLFLAGEAWAQIGFLVVILFSRVGLYGFSLGEVQIRQEGIHPSVRGQVNGFASALTGLATLLLFAFGTALPNTEDFKYLIFLSTSCICIAFLIFARWAKSK